MLTPESMDAVFHALAHAHRRLGLDIVRASPGCPVGEVCEHFDTSRVAILKHLRVLEDAGLIVSEKDGRLRRLYFNAAPIQLIYDRWTTEYSSFWAGRLADIKRAVESGGEAAAPSQPDADEPSSSQRAG